MTQLKEKMKSLSTADASSPMKKRISEAHEANWHREMGDFHKEKAASETGRTKKALHEKAASEYHHKANELAKAYNSKYFNHKGK